MGTAAVMLEAYLRNLVDLDELESMLRDLSEGRVTLARAARNAGVSLWEMIDYARARKVSAQYDLEDLKHDLGVIDASLEIRE